MSHLCTLANQCLNSCFLCDKIGHISCERAWRFLSFCKLSTANVFVFVFSSLIFCLIYQLEKYTYLHTYFVLLGLVHSFNAHTLIPPSRDVCWKVIIILSEAKLCLLLHREVLQCYDLQFFSMHQWERMWTKPVLQ